MIREILISMLVITFSACTVNADFSSEIDYQPSRLFVGVVIDSSPTSDKAWNIRKSRAVELASSLKAGDKIVVVEARPGRPSIRASAVVGKPEKTGLNEVISSISVLGKELLSKADVARGVETLCDLFQTEGQDYHCCIIALTNGYLSDRQVNKILRLTSRLSDLNHSVCFTCDPAAANQVLIDASKSKLLDIRLVSNPRLVFWLQSVRESITPSTQPILSVIPPADINDIKADEILPAEPEEPDQSEIQRIDIVVDANEIKEPFEPNKIEEAPDTTIGSSWRVILIIIVFILLLSATVVLVGLRFRKKSMDTSDVDSYRESEFADDSVINLKAIVGDRDVDLGPLETISEISIGSDLSCALCIEDDRISGRHARVFRARRGLKIQNNGIAPITVNGFSIKTHQKQNLDLPAEIEIVPEVAVSLYTEPIEREKEYNKNEEVN